MRVCARYRHGIPAVTSPARVRTGSAHVAHRTFVIACTRLRSYARTDIRYRPRLRRLRSHPRVRTATEDGRAPTHRPHIQAAARKPCEAGCAACPTCSADTARCSGRRRRAHRHTHFDSHSAPQHRSIRITPQAAAQTCIAMVSSRTFGRARRSRVPRSTRGVALLGPPQPRTAECGRRRGPGRAAYGARARPAGTWQPIALPWPQGTRL